MKIKKVSKSFKNQVSERIFDVEQKVEGVGTVYGEIKFSSDKKEKNGITLSFYEGKLKWDLPTDAFYVLNPYFNKISDGIYPDETIQGFFELPDIPCKVHDGSNPTLCDILDEASFPDIDSKEYEESILVINQILIGVTDTFYYHS